VSVHASVQSVRPKRRYENPVQHDSDFRYGTFERHVGPAARFQRAGRDAFCHIGILTIRISIAPQPEAVAQAVSIDMHQRDPAEAVMNSRIVVGVGGSMASVGALRWAAEEAARLQAQVVVVWAWHPEQLAPYANVSGHPDAVQLRQDAERGLAAALLQALGTETPAGIACEVADGVAERVLVNRSEGADLLVLGSTSVPTVVGRCIGPVIRSCLSRAHCPVVVIGPESLPCHHNAGTGGILVPAR
jgi:nucleotide-binding universal stress UspA family protein